MAETFQKFSKYRQKVQSNLGSQMILASFKGWWRNKDSTNFLLELAFNFELCHRASKFTFGEWLTILNQKDITCFFFFFFARIGDNSSEMSRVRSRDEVVYLNITCFLSRLTSFHVRSATSVDFAPVSTNF